MAFQAPFEIAQSQLLHLKVSSVDASEAVGGLFPFFDDDGRSRFLAIDTRAGGSGGSAGLWAVEEFPLEIRLHKAIYPRPIVRYRPLVELEPEAFARLYHFDPRGTLAGEPGLPELTASSLSAGNLARRSRGREWVRDLFFTRDLRRVTGAVIRAGMLFPRRLEMAGLRGFIQSASASRSVRQT